MDFNDYLYLSGGSASGPTQIGAGVSTYAVLGDYSQGSFESSNSGTDLAIDGNGYFGVRKPNSNQTYYTRAGDFYFNQNRELQNPEGYLLQGWKVDNEKKLTFNGGATNLGTSKTVESAYVGSGTPTDIVLDSWNIKPRQTTNVSFTMGLTNNGAGDKTTSATSPLTALFDLWDASSTPPMASGAYATQSSIDVYDEGGSSHTLTVYYDQVDVSKTDSKGNLLYKIEGMPSNYTIYEYLVTIPPAEDQRSYGGEGYNQATNTWAKEPTKFYDDPDAGTNKNAGVLMSGVLIFDASGQLVNQTAYTFGAAGGQSPNSQYAGNPADKSSWQPTKFSSNGLPVFTANFSGQPLANSVSETMRTAGSSTPYSQAQEYITELDLGLKNISPTWDNSSVYQILRDKNGNPLSDRLPDGTSGYVAIGSDKYGYYFTQDDSTPPASGQFYGKSEAPADLAGRWVGADSYGYYVEEDKKAGKLFDGTMVYQGSDNKYYIFDEALDRKTNLYTQKGTVKIPVYEDEFGYYTQASPTAERVYSRGNTEYYHDENGFYFNDNSGRRRYGIENNTGRPVYHDDVYGFYYLEGVTRKPVAETDFTRVDIDRVRIVNPTPVTPEQPLDPSLQNQDSGNVYGTLNKGNVYVKDEKYCIYDKELGKYTPYYNLDESSPPKTVYVYNDGIGYYTQADVDAPKVYGTYKENATTTAEVMHNSTGFYIEGADGKEIYGHKGTQVVYYSPANGFYVDNGGGQVVKLKEEDFLKIADDAAKFTATPHNAVAPDTKISIAEDSKPHVAYENQGNTLDTLAVTLTQKGMGEDGYPIYENIIKYGSSLPTMASAERQNYASVANVSTPTIRDRSQDGYAAGTLSSVNIDEAGVVHGVYSNGKTLPLYQIALYDFQNLQGLYREGGNLFSATQDSGEPRLGVAGDNGFGTTNAYNIEQSNVDMTREFVQMITTQRGFQANSKGITTVDTMLETVIGMKR
ncbi:flagellar hook-basal body complex protein [Desulfovibrio porci]|uniref:flagellar hook-basal body complex protein n=1 Tax=Desulfovibrio porci TaxID=2605782 RepID=UPI003A9123FC